MSTRKNLGFFSLIALVIGNMIGSGAFLLPASLAKYGSIGIVAWIFTTVGAIFLALIFSRLSRMIPKVGGPYAYCREAYGNGIGFFVAYNYWIAIWAGNAAIDVALVAYLSYFFPVLNTNHFLSFLVACAILWTLTAINVIGVRLAGFVQVVTTVLKLIPLVCIALVGLFFIHSGHLAQFNVSGKSNFSALIASAALTFWSFIGLESATVPAEDAINPEKNIPRATVLGTIIAAIVYILGTLVIMGVMPMSQLAQSSSPYATAGVMIFGHWAGIVFAIAAIIATFGTLNGWILLHGQIPYAAAKDDLFPKPFAKLSKTKTPAFGLIFSSILITILLTLSYNQNFVSQFTIIILLATFSNIIPYLYTSVAELILTRKLKHKPNSTFAIALAIVTFACLALAIMGTSIQAIYYWIILFISSIPVYAWLQYKKGLQA